MGRKSKKPAGRSKPRRSSRVRTWWLAIHADRKRAAARGLLWVAVWVLLAVGAAVGMRALERQVVRAEPGGRPGRADVRLARVPAWMPASLARDIAADLTPPDARCGDPQLARTVYQRAVRNPWVRRARSVDVRPGGSARAGTVVVRADFRRPVARVRTESPYVYVDAEGFVLPGSQVPKWVVTFRDGRHRVVRQRCFLARGEIPLAWRAAAKGIHYIIIDGVAAAPPPPGWHWQGGDLAAGLCLVRLVGTRPYHDQITVVNVQNHAGRITRNEPELRMYAQVARRRVTDIRFGRFPLPGGGDYIIGPERKMSYLDEYVERHGGQLAGVNDYLDLRFDELHVSIN